MALAAPTADDLSVPGVAASQEIGSDDAYAQMGFAVIGGGVVAATQASADLVLPGLGGNGHDTLAVDEAAGGAARSLWQAAPTDATVVGSIHTVSNEQAFLLGGSSAAPTFADIFSGFGEIPSLSSHTAATVSAPAQGAPAAPPADTGSAPADVTVAQPVGAHFTVDDSSVSHITAFNGAAGDSIDVSALLTHAGYAGSDPFADGYLKYVGDPLGNAELWSNGHEAGLSGIDNGWHLVATLDGVATSSLHYAGGLIT